MCEKMPEGKGPLLQEVEEVKEGSKRHSCSCKHLMLKISIVIELVKLLLPICLATKHLDVKEQK